MFKQPIANVSFKIFAINIIICKGRCYKSSHQLLSDIDIIKDILLV